MHDYWLKQTTDKPLYEELIWSRPENKTLAGKLLIIGGTIHGFSQTVVSYTESARAGAGSVKVIMPDSTKKIVGTNLEDVEFAPSNVSGGFAKSALTELSELSNWSDALLLPGEIGNNSETAVLMERFLTTYQGPIISSGDSIDITPTIGESDTFKGELIFSVDFSELQKLVTRFKAEQAITSKIGLVNLVEALHDLTAKHKFGLITIFNNSIVCAYNGNVTTTEMSKQGIGQSSLAVFASVWLMQNKNEIIKSLTCAAWAIQQ